MSTALARNGNGIATTLNRTGPWSPLNDFFGFDPFQHLRASYGFEYDVTRTENGYEVDVPVPGFSSDQLDISFKDQILTIAGKNDRRTLSRSMLVPEDVDAESINARVEHGLLRLTLQRHPQAQPKKINVT